MNKMLRKLKKSKKAYRVIYYIINILYLVTLALFIKNILSLKGIETFIRVIVIIFFILYFFIYSFWNLLNLLRRKYKGLIITSIITLLFIMFFSVSSYYINFVYSNINNMKEKKEVIYNSYLIVLSDKTFNKDSVIGIIDKDIDKDNYDLAQKLIKEEKLYNKVEYYNDYIKLIFDLYKGVIDAAIVPGNFENLVKNEVGFENIDSDVKKVFEYSEKKKNEDLDLVSNKDFNEPLTFLFLGVDSEGDGLNASSSFNGDTLMLMSINPKTLNAILLSIPRDTYVPITCNKNNYAKINSSAGFGTSCVISTINNLMGINIDYYVKINFKGVVDLVEAVKGIDVFVEAPTYTPNKYKGKVCEQNSDRQFGNKLVCMEPGLQTLNGEQALAYARCRHMYIGSDLDRVRHQQQVVEALANKALHFSSIKDLQNILTAVSKNISTNMDTDTMLSGYNVLKNVVGSKLSGTDGLNISKATLETYSLNVYVPQSGRNTSAQGYYLSSLNDIKHAFNVVLDKEKDEMVKTFSFSVNETYELYSPGKGKRTEKSGELLPSFVGKTVEEAKEFCNQYNISLNVKYVDPESEFYNKSVNVGLIGNQSVYKDVLVNSISELTVYIVNSKVEENSNNSTDDNKDNNLKSDEDIIKDMLN